MTQQITHPFHQHHVLSLLPKPTHLLFCCNACGNQIHDAFTYQCRTCDIDLHVTCASLPMSVAHPSHPHHLNLAFSPPYSNGKFTCNICRELGSGHWVYHCSPCQFDVHLGCCTNANPGVPIQAPTLQQNQMQHYQAAPVQNPTYQVQVGTQFATRPPLNNYSVPSNYVNNTNPSSNVRPNVGNGMWNQIYAGLVIGATQALGQSLVQGLLGGGGGSGTNDGGDGGPNDGGDGGPNDGGNGGDTGGFGGDAGGF